MDLSAILIPMFALLLAFLKYDSICSTYCVKKKNSTISKITNVLIDIITTRENISFFTRWLYTVNARIHVRSHVHVSIHVQYVEHERKIALTSITIYRTIAHDK